MDGRRTINLTGSVINIGRRLDNQIIVDDARVSRSHAQLRLRFGHYVVYNLGSTGGTFVNGRRVEECVLRPGDVISLGGVPLIYGEDGTQHRAFVHQERINTSSMGGVGSIRGMNTIRLQDGTPLNYVGRQHL